MLVHINYILNTSSLSFIINKKPSYLIDMNIYSNPDVHFPGSSPEKYNQYKTVFVHNIDIKQAFVNKRNISSPT